GSLNGTWVNESRITAATRLAPQDVVRLGTTRLRVFAEERTNTPGPSRPAPGTRSPTADHATPAPSHGPERPAPSQPALVPDVLGRAQEDELRPVTALFADIVGSTGIGERLPPEEVKTLVGECVTRMSRIVEQYGGVIDAYMGDGIAAFFGVPIAREDDVERAARAALRILESIGRYAKEVQATWTLPDFGIRIGMNTGQVAVGLVGSGERRPVALGDTMNVAARLQSAAEPG